ncbi:MAG: MFS transporter [Hyphomicrobiaceae bacterium]
MTKAPESAPFSRGSLAALLLSVATVAAGYGIVLPILPLMLQVIDGPNATAAVARHTGLLTALHAVALFLFAPLWGWLSDRHGRRPILIIGLMGFGISLLVSSLKPSIELLYAERFLTGAFAAAITPVAAAAIADQGGSDEWRARHLAWLGMASISGFLLGPMLSGSLAALSKVLASTEADVRQSYELPFVVVASTALIAALAVRLSITNQVSAPTLQTSAPTPSLDVNAQAIWMLRAVSFIVAAGVGTFEVGLALRGNQDLGMDPRRIAFMFTTCSLVMFMVQAVVFSPMIKPDSTRWFIAPALAVMAIALFLVPRAGEYASLLGLIAIVAASAGVLSPILTYWVSLESGHSKGAELGKQTAVTSLGQALGSFLGGSLFASTVIPGASFVLTAIVLAAAAIACRGLPGRLSYERAIADAPRPNKALSSRSSPGASQKEDYP